MTGPHLSPTDLDVLVLDGAPIDRGLADGLEQHLSQCPDCQERRQRRAARRADFERDQLPRLLARMPPAIRRARRRPLILSLILVPVGAAVVLIANPTVRGPATDTPVRGQPSVGPPGVKGTPGLRLIARRGETVFEVPTGATLQPGDALRFVLEPVGRPYLLIASLDGQGRASVYHPFGGPGSVRVDPGQMVEAPAGSVILDAARGPERVFALWSSEPLEAGDILARLKDLGRRGPAAIRSTNALDVPDTIQISRLFEKGDAP